MGDAPPTRWSAVILRGLGSQLTFLPWLIYPSDDSWLEIAPEQLDEMMRKAAGYLPKEEVCRLGWHWRLKCELTFLCLPRCLPIWNLWCLG